MVLGILIAFDSPRNSNNSHHLPLNRVKRTEINELCTVVDVLSFITFLTVGIP